MERSPRQPDNTDMTASNHLQFSSRDGKKMPKTRPALRIALEALALENTTRREAARRAGMDESALGRALNKPHIQAEIDAIKINALASTEPLRRMARAQAIRVGIDLMHNAKSEAVRARMVEFFAGEGKANASVTVQVSENRGGYSFARPGSEIVDVTPPDTTSGEGDG